MKPGRFDYLRAGDVDEVVRALAGADGEGKILAGGQSLVPVLAMRLAQPALLVDVNRVPGLGEIRTGDGVVHVGALVRHRALTEQAAHPLLAEAARWIGHAAIRSRGTVGGSLVHADPAAELPAVAVATGAVAHVTGPGGTRTVTADELFDGALQTSLADDEMLIGLDVPVPARWGFAEFARRHGDFALVTAVACEVDGVVRLVVGGVAGVPFRAAEAEAVLAGGGTPDAAADAAAAAVDPAADLHSSAGHRRALVAEMARRALHQLRGRAG